MTNILISILCIVTVIAVRADLSNPILLLTIAVLLLNKRSHEHE